MLSGVSAMTERGEAVLHAIAGRIATMVEAVGGQGRAAELLGVSRGTVQKWRTADARPPLIEIGNLAEAAGTTLHWVLTGMEPPERDDILRIPVIGAGGASWPLPRASVLGRVRSIEQAAIYVVQGREMEPFIQQGDATLIDLGDRDVSRSGGRVYLLRRGGALALARAFAVSLGMVEIYDETPKAKRQKISRDDLPKLDVVGRVALTLSEP